MGYTNLVKGLPNWLVWCDKSPQQVGRQGEKSPLQSGGEPMPHSNSNSNSHSYSDVFNDLDDDFKLEKSGLNGNVYMYGLWDVLLSPVFDTVGAAADTSQPVFNLRPTGIGLSEFGDLEYYLIGLLSASAATIGNEIKIRFDSGTLWGQCTQTQIQTQQQNTAAPAIDSNNKKCTTGIGLCDFNINEYVFGVVYTVSPANDNGNEIKMKIYNYNLQFTIYI